MKNINYLKIFVIVLSIAAFGGLFMPYQKSIGEYREGLLKVPNETYIEGVDLKNSDAVDLTIMENFKVYRYAMDNNDGNSWIEGTATINVVITVVLILAIVLVLLFAILNKNLTVIIFNAILGLCSLSMNYDIASRGGLPSDNYTYGISYYLFIVIAILILISTITLIILKKNPKLLERKTVNQSDEPIKKNDVKEKNSAVGTLELSKIFDKLKKYWYIVIIVVVIIISMLFLLYNKPNDDGNNSNNSNNKTNEVDNNDNNSGGTFTEKSETASNVEYTITKAANGDYVIIIGKNKNSGINDIEIEVEFYDENDNFVGSASEDVSAADKNLEFAVRLYDAPKAYDHYKVFIDVEKNDNKSYANKLKATSNNTGEKIVGQVKNTTDDEIEYIGISIVYYKDNKVVGYGDTLESDIKPGRTANFEFIFPYDSNFDDLEFDTYKIFVNEAYTYVW